jgi:hypothetical protein
VGLLEDMLSMGLAGVMLSVGFAGVASGWLCHNGRTNNMPEVGLDWFGKPMMEKENDMMESIVDDGGSFAWCG